MAIEVSLDEAIAKIIEKIAVRIKNLTDPTKEPALFVRGVHSKWKVAGGKVAGKPRHSDQYLRDRLNAAGTPVKSLTPKLVGKTNIGGDDGAALLRFFLSNWPEAGVREGEIVHKTVLSEEEIDAVSNYVAGRIKEKRAGAGGLMPLESADAGLAEMLPGTASAELIARLFQESDALITVSPERVFVADAPKTEFIGFRGLMDMLRDIEMRDHRRRPLIWVLDLGGPKLSDPVTREKYLNVQQLIGRFKALNHFKDDYSEARWEWLSSRVIIILLHSYGDWGEKISLTRRPNFFPHHACLTSVNTEWMADPNFRALFGHNLDRVKQRVLTVFYNASQDWASMPEKEGDLRYFGYASFDNGKGEYVGRGLELTPLSERNAEAFRTIYAAAAYNLNLKIVPSKEMEIDGEQATQQLNYLGLRVLRLDEFLEMY